MDVKQSSTESPSKPPAANPASSPKPVAPIEVEQETVDLLGTDFKPAPAQDGLSNDDLESFLSGAAPAKPIQPTVCLIYSIFL